MSFQKTKIARFVGVILAASSCVFPAFAGPQPAKSQESYCPQPAQKDPLLKAFKVSGEQLAFLLKQGGESDAFTTATQDGNEKYPIHGLDSRPITGPFYCRAALDLSIDSDFNAFQNFFDQCINPEKKAQSKGLSQSKQNQINFDAKLGDWESRGGSQKLGERKAQAALLLMKKPLSCEAVKQSAKNVLSEDVYDAIILPPNPASGMDQGQEKEMQKHVANALSGATNSFGTKGSGAAPSPSSGGMGNLASQTQGQSSQTSGTGSSGATKTSPNGNPQNTDQLPLLPKTKAPPATPPAPTTNKPKKSKPGFFAKIWNGIKKVGHYIISSRIGTGLMLGLAAALMVTGFGAAPGVIIAAAVLGAGIGLAAGPLTKSSASKALPPPPPIASSPTNSQNPSPTPTAPSPNPPAATTPPEGNVNLNTSGTMDKANDIAKQLNQNKPTENDTVPGPATVTARNTTQNSQASKTRATAHPKNPGQHSKTSSVPSSPNKSAKAKASKVPIPIAKSAVEGAVLGGGLGWGLAAAGIISAPVWASAALGVAAGAAVAAAGVAAWNYFKNKPTPAKPKAKPQKNQNPGNTPKTQALPKPPIPGPQEM